MKIVLIFLFLIVCGSSKGIDKYYYVDINKIYIESSALFQNDNSKKAIEYLLAEIAKRIKVTISSREYTQKYRVNDTTYSSYFSNITAVTEEIDFGSYQIEKHKIIWNNQEYYHYKLRIDKKIYKRYIENKLLQIKKKIDFHYLQVKDIHQLNSFVSTLNVIKFIKKYNKEILIAKSLLYDFSYLDNKQYIKLQSIKNINVYYAESQHMNQLSDYGLIITDSFFKADFIIKTLPDNVYQIYEIKTMEYLEFKTTQESK